jgi:hypothetical protein
MMYSKMSHYIIDAMDEKMVADVPFRFIPIFVNIYTSKLKKE